MILKGDGEVRIGSNLDMAQSAGISGLMGLKIVGRSRGVTGAELLGEDQHPRLQLNQGDKSWGAIVSSPTLITASVKVRGRGTCPCYSEVALFTYPQFLCVENPTKVKTNAWNLSSWA